MIYLKPETVDAALEAYRTETDAGRTPCWYSGGTEILTLLRRNALPHDVFIDLKGIPAYSAHQKDAEGWTLGAGLPLNTLLEDTLPQPLKACIAPIADHTVRNRLSLGGNLCGRLPYREAVLPLLALDAQVTIAAAPGFHTVPLRTQFNRQMNLAPESFLLEVRIPKPEPDFRWGSSRKVRLGTVDYPVVHVLITEASGQYSLYASGICPYPVMLANLDAAQLRDPERLALPTPPQGDRLASRAYRSRLFALALRDAMDQIGGRR